MPNCCAGSQIVYSDVVSLWPGIGIGEVVAAEGSLKGESFVLYAWSESCAGNCLDWIRLKARGWVMASAESDGDRTASDTVSFDPRRNIVVKWDEFWVLSFARLFVLCAWRREKGGRERRGI